MRGERVEVDMNHNEETGGLLRKVLWNITKCLTVTSGLTQGIVRMAIFLPILLLFIVQVRAPPLSNDVEDDSVQNEGIKIVTANWAYMRFILECLATFILMGDTTVTYLSLSWNTASRYSFLSLFAMPHWLLRFILTLVACSGVSCDAYAYIETTLSPELAKAYLIIALLPVICSTLTLLLWKINIIKEENWLSSRTKRNDGSECVWTLDLIEQNETLQKSSPGKSQFIQRLVILFNAFICIAMNFWGLIAVSLGTRSTCSIWLSCTSYSIHLIINGFITGNTLLLLIKKTEERDYHLMKWLSVYTLSAVMADLQNLMTNVPGLITLHILGFILISLVPLLSIEYPFNCKASLEKNAAALHEFLKNFTQFNKWLRVFTVVFYILAMTGAILALLSIQFDWFTLNFEPEGDLKDLIQTKEEFKAALVNILEELQKVANLPSFIEPCTLYLGAITSAFGLALVPGAGPIASKAAVAGLRAVRFKAKMAKKALKYAKQFKNLQSLTSDMTDVEHALRKPLVVAMSIDNFNLAIFILPIILTGIIAFAFAFWPRKISASNKLKQQKKKATIFITALMLVVFNAFGLVLFETFGPLMATIVSAMPLVKGSLVREPGWWYVETAYICALVASFIMLVNSIIMLKENWNILRCKSNAKLKKAGLEDSQQSSIEDLPQSTSGSTENLLTLQTTKQQELQGISRIFRGNMMDMMSSGTVSTQGWILSIIIMSVSFGLSVASINMDWITFDPTLKAKYATIIHSIREATKSTLTLRSELDDDAKLCDIFPVGFLGKMLKILLSVEVLDLWENFIFKLQLPEFDLLDINIAFRIYVPNIFALVFAIPSLVCWVLVVAGFAASFHKTARFFYSGQDVMEWITKIAIFEVSVVINVVLSITKLLMGLGLPLFTLNVTTGNGLVLWTVAQVLVLVVWVLLQIETVVPIQLEYHNESEATDDTKWITHKNLPTGSFV